MTLSEIISGMDRITGPDRSIDAKIGEILSPELGFTGVTWSNGEPYFSGKGPGFKVWKYTASIDSAIRIIPRKWFLEEIYRDYPSLPYEVTVKTNGFSVTGKSKVISLAVCIAAIRARAVELALSQYDNR